MQQPERLRMPPPPPPDRSTELLVLAILSLIVCPVLAPPLWIVARSDLRAIIAGERPAKGERRTRAALICAVIGTGVLILAAVLISIWWVTLGAIVVIIAIVVTLAAILD